MVSTLSSCAASINEQVFTMTASACATSLVISIPSFSKEPSMISASTRFLAHPSEIIPTRCGFGWRFCCCFMKYNSDQFYFPQSGSVGFRRCLRLLYRVGGPDCGAGATRHSIGGCRYGRLLFHAELAAKHSSGLVREARVFYGQHLIPGDPD